MEKEVAALLGEPVMEGVILLPRGAGKKYRKNAVPMGGLLGFAVRAAAEKMAKDDPADADDVASGRKDLDLGAFLALTSSRLVIFTIESGRLKQKLGEQLVSFNLGELDRFELAKGVVGVGLLDIVSVTGDRWCYEYSKVVGKKITRIAEATRTLVVETD